GGDEFIVILPNTTGENAPKRAEKWRNQIEVFTLLHRKDQALRITFSAGIATYPTHGQTIEEILKRADIALYRAKLNGRDRSELFNQEEM
ncbi:MAG: GGDEF domain-containing protein, partial [Anaerolineae bacterium]|nr:GGDEF domain-containing protein [Anaerolineae bacterium]